LSLLGLAFDDPAAITQLLGPPLRRLVPCPSLEYGSLGFGDLGLGHGVRPAETGGLVGRGRFRPRSGGA
jgi:hypothetical protein